MTDFTITLTVTPWLLLLLLLSAGAWVGLGAFLLTRHRRREAGARASSQPTRPSLSLVTTDDILCATGLSRRTLHLWINAGVVPAPVALLRDGACCSFFPSWILDRVWFIASKKQAGYSLSQIRTMVDDPSTDPPPTGGGAAFGERGSYDPPVRRAALGERGSYDPPVHRPDGNPAA